MVEFDQSSVAPITSPYHRPCRPSAPPFVFAISDSSSPFLIHLGPSPSRFFGASSTLPKNNLRIAPAKKMRRLPPPKRALLEPYSPSTDTCTPYQEGLAAEGFEPIGPSLSQINVLSGSETIAPSSSQTNAPHGFEICEASPFETQTPSPQSQTSGAGASSSRRVRGPTIGKATAKRVANNNGNKLHIPITETFNAFEGVLATPGANEIGIQIRRMCPIQGVKSWTVADPATKGAVVQAVRMDELVHKAKLYRTN